MNKMGNFRMKLARFMYGRYGMDQLYNGLLGVALVLLVASLFIRSVVINILVWVILILMLYRTLSRNLTRRRRENELFLKAWNPAKSKGKLAIRRMREIKTHRYRKCPHCKQMLRLPRKVGKHTVKCPRCSNPFDVRVWF
jgi:uncharacterized paraquat-inducible protein A